MVRECCRKCGEFRPVAYSDSFGDFCEECEPVAKDARRSLYFSDPNNRDDYEWAKNLNPDDEDYDYLWQVNQN